MVPTVVDHVAYFDGGSGVMAIELGEQPAVRWTVEVRGSVLGVDGGYVYILANGREIRTLTVEEGAEYWRMPLDDFGELRSFPLISYGGIVVETSDENSRLNLIVIDRDGQVSWRIDRSFDLDWIVSDTITTLAQEVSDYDGYRIATTFVESGTPIWELRVGGSQWDATEQPVLCAGKAYVLLRDLDSDKYLLAVIDPAEGIVVGSWESALRPLFIADGIMLAWDYDTDDIVAIGTVPAALQPGGRATVTEDATLRGAPSTTAIERTQLAAGTVIDVTGESDTSNGAEWFPVYEHDTGQYGWLPAEVLVGQDGSVRFSTINLSEFGQFTAYPTFNAGTRAEITEKVDLRGAPSESSAKKATLDAGTLVTVTSPPTETDDGEWCPIKVYETGESGWVPTSVLKLAPRG